MGLSKPKKKKIVKKKDLDPEKEKPLRNTEVTPIINEKDKLSTNELK